MRRLLIVSLCLLLVLAFAPQAKGAGLVLIWSTSAQGPTISNEGLTQLTTRDDPVLCQNTVGSNRYCFYGATFQMPASASNNLAVATFKLTRIGSPVGFIAGVLYALQNSSAPASDPVPSPTALATSTNQIAMAAINNVTFQNYNFTFTAPILTVGSWYLIGIRTTVPSSTVDFTDQISLFEGSTGYSGTVERLQAIAGVGSWSNLVASPTFSVYAGYSDCQSLNCLDLYLNVTLAAGLIGLVCWGTAIIYGGMRILGDKELAWIGYSLILMVLGTGLLLVWAQG